MQIFNIENHRTMMVQHQEYYHIVLLNYQIDSIWITSRTIHHTHLHGPSLFQLRIHQSLFTDLAQHTTSPSECKRGIHSRPFRHEFHTFVSLQRY